MASKLKLIPNPTFKHTVNVPVAGGEAEAVEFVFKHKKQSEINAMFAPDAIGQIDTDAIKADTDFVLEFVSGWDLDADFNRENVALFLENYSGATQLLFREYADEINKARWGN